MGVYEMFDEIKNSVVKGQGADSKQIIKTLRDQGISTDYVLKGSVMPAFKEIGDLMQEEEYAFPEVQTSMKVLQTVMSDLFDIYDVKQASADEIPAWEGEGELFELGEYIIEYIDKGENLSGYDLMLYIEGCMEGMLSQVGLPCKKQADSTKKS